MRFMQALEDFCLCVNSLQNISRNDFSFLSHISVRYRTQSGYVGDTQEMTLIMWLQEQIVS
jgi:hypothetical protein